LRTGISGYYLEGCITRYVLRSWRQGFCLFWHYLYMVDLSFCLCLCFGFGLNIWGIVNTRRSCGHFLILLMRFFKTSNFKDGFIRYVLAMFLLRFRDQHGEAIEHSKIRSKWSSDRDEVFFFLNRFHCISITEQTFCRLRKKATLICGRHVYVPARGRSQQPFGYTLVAC
jgi:hypothetical protein